jgi:hypothetical protein
VAQASAATDAPKYQGTTLLHVIALAVLALAHLFDYTSFLLMVSRHGLAAEANPIVVRIAEEAGLPGLTLAKVVTVGLAAVLMVAIAPRRRRLAMGLLMFGIGAGMVGGISNVATL